MLERRLTDDEDAPYKKLYRMSIPDDANPPVSTDPPEDTVQGMYTQEDEVLVSFDPEVLEWYPSVVIPLPQHELFEYLLDEMQSGLSWDDVSEIVYLTGRVTETGISIQTEQHEGSTPTVSMYASSQSEQRLTLDISLPLQREAQETLQHWLTASEHIQK